MKSKLSNSASFEPGFFKLWEEYEERKTPESKLVKDLDRFEMVLQAEEYESENPGLDLTDFFQSVRGKINNPMIQEWCEELELERMHRKKL